MARSRRGYSQLLVLEEVPTTLGTIGVLKIAASILAGSIVFALVFRFSIDFPTVAVVAASVGLVVAIKLGLRDRLRRWGTVAAILFTVLSGFAYVRHVDGKVAHERQAALNEQMIKDAHEAAQRQRESQKQVAREAAAREEQRKRESAEEAERVAQANRDDAELAILRRSNPERYLERIKAAKGIAFWVEEAKVLRPKIYAAYLEEQRVQKAALENRPQKIPSVNYLKLETSWVRDGLDRTLVVTFTITSARQLPVHDVLVQCDGRANSDAIIWTKAFPLHEIVPPGSTTRLAKISLGPIPGQMSQLVCRIAGVQ